MTFATRLSAWAARGGVTLSLALLACTQPSDRTAAATSGDTLGEAMTSAVPLRGAPSIHDADDEEARAPQLVQRVSADSVTLEVAVQPGDQINALQPPVLTYDDGRRLVFRGSAMTSDSSYFVGAVTARVARSALPIHGRLVTSYCRAGEKLCRSATRDIDVE